MAYFRDNIEALKGYEPGLQPKQRDIIKLNTNENPFPPSPEVMKALGRIDTERLRRYPDPVGEDFRHAAAEVHGVDPENIFNRHQGPIEGRPVIGIRESALKFDCFRL